MNPSEALASISAFVLLVLLVPVAEISTFRRHPLHALGLWGIALALGCIAAGPGLWFVPPAEWPTAMLLLMVAIQGVWLRKRFWQAARSELGYEPAEHPERRTSDWAALYRQDEGQPSEHGA